MKNLSPDIVEYIIDGYETGSTWPDKWDHIPGGPFAYDEQTRLRRSAWLAGWKAGKAKKDRLKLNITVEEHIQQREPHGRM